MAQEDEIRADYEKLLSGDEEVQFQRLVFRNQGQIEALKTDVSVYQAI